MLKRLAPHFRADRLGGQTVIAFGLRAWGAAAAFALSWLVAQRFGPEGVGLYGLALTTVVLLHYLVLAGLDSTLVRVAAGDLREGRRDRARGAVRAAGGAVLVAAPTVAAVLWLAREPFAARWLDQPAVAPLLALMLLAVTPLALQRIASAALRVAGRPLASQLIDGPAGTTLAALGLAALIAAGAAASLAAPAALYVAGVALSAAAGWLLWRRVRRDWPAAAPVAWAPLLAAGLPVLASNLSNIFTEWWTTVSLGAAWPAAVVGQYRVAWQIVALAGMLQVAMDAMLGPRIAAAAQVGDKPAIARTARRAVLLVLGLAAPLFGVIFAFPETLLGLFGPGFAGGATALLVLAAGQLVRLASGPLGTILVMTGSQRWMLLYGLAGVVLCVGFAAWLIPPYGAVGAAAATAATVTLRNLGAGLVVRYALDINLFARAAPVRRDIRIGLTWHAVAARNLGVGALTLGNIALAREAAARAGLTPRFIVVSPRETAPPYVIGADVALRTLDARYMASPGGYLADLRRLDIVLDIGAGDSFTDTYADKRFAYIIATKALPIGLGRPLVLSPQTIGPFSRQPHSRLAAWACRRSAAVFARDPLSTAALAKLAPGARAFEAIDVAFAMPFERPAPAGDGRLRVGINVSGLLFNGGYTGRGEFGMDVDYPVYTRALLAALAARPDVAVELICHVSAPEQPRDDDGAVADRLAAEFSGVVRTPDFASPVAAKSHISGLDFLVGARMHATIAAYSTGVPVVPISYSRKFEGLFGGLGYPHVVPRTGVTTEAALATTRAALDRRDELRVAIAAGRPVVERGLETYVAELARLFEGGGAVIPSPTLDKVRRGDLCSGCGLCAGVSGGAVTMALAGPGWLRPRQTATLDPATEATVAAACPAVVIDEHHDDKPRYDPLWGPWRRVATGYATDEALRRNASSGGIISALAQFALATGRVDHVVQTGADPEAPLGNRTGVSATAAEVYAAAGSRYAPSAPLAEIERWLALPGRFAFIGKPCDVSALRALARRDPRIDAKCPLMLAFFCAGVPAAAGARRMLERLGVDEDAVAAFRYRGDGWPGFATATRRDGTQARMSYADSWGDILSKHVQFRCKICPDAVGGDADVAAADAWYGDERGYPRFDEQEGRSLMIARTVAGEALWREAEAAGAIQTTPLDIGEVIRMQPAQARRKRQVLSRLAAMRVAGRPVPRYRGVRLAAAARQERFANQIRSFAGLLRRLAQGRA